MQPMNTIGILCVRHVPDACDTYMFHTLLGYFNVPDLMSPNRGPANHDMRSPSPHLFHMYTSSADLSVELVLGIKGMTDSGVL